MLAFSHTGAVKVANEQDFILHLQFYNGCHILSPLCCLTPSSAGADNIRVCLGARWAVLNDQALHLFDIPFLFQSGCGNKRNED